MKEEQFITKYSGVWKELEELSSSINKTGIKSLKSSEVKRFLLLFRQSSHNLAYSRTHYPGSRLTAYLNSLISRCHSNVYAVRKASPDSIMSYFFNEFPRLLKECRAYILLSFGIFIFGALLGVLMTFSNPENARFFLPPDIIEGMKNDLSSQGNWNHPLMSSYIITNNIGVSLRAFALGITLGLGTIYVLFYNGALLGALTALVYIYNNSPTRYWSLILPHGVIELAAIYISGAAGLIIAKSLLVPGDHTRWHSLIKGSKSAVSLVMGIALMLIIAGIIEGFFTPLDINPWAKLLFAAATALALGLYLYIPYRKKKN